MYKFGPNEPRSLKSFGVAGLLAEDCTVFYDSLLNPLHLGRVSDLVCARLRDVGADDARLRMLLLIGFYQSYRAQSVDGGWSVQFKGNLDEPVVVEIGIDKSKLAVGVSFSLEDASSFDIEGIASKIIEKPTEDSFETLLHFLLLQSDRLVLRAQSSENRFEVVALLGTSDEIEDKVVPLEERLEIVNLVDGVEDTPKAGTYVEMGDVDYDALLKDPEFTSKYDQEDTADTVISGVTENLEDEATTVRGKFDEEDESTLVKGSKEEEDKSKTVISGGGGKGEDKTVTIIKGGSAPKQEKNWLKIKSNTDVEVDDVNGILDSREAPEIEDDDSPQVKLYKAQMEQLLNRIAELEVALESGDFEYEDEEGSKKKKKKKRKKKREGDEEDVEDSDEDYDEDDDEEDDEDEDDDEFDIDMQTVIKGGKQAFSFVKENWKFWQKEEEPEPEPEPEEEEEKEDLSDLIGEDDVEKDVSELNDAKDLAKNLLLSVEAGSFDHAIKKFKDKSWDIKKNMKDTESRQALDSLMAELQNEKEKFKEATTKLARSVRQKELELKNVEQKWEDELAGREELFSKKENELIRAKEEIAHKKVQIEKMHKEVAEAQEAKKWEKKYNHSQNIMDGMKEETVSLKKKIEELKGDLMKAQSEAVALDTGELDKAKQELKIAEKRSDEYKRRAERLQDKVKEAHKRTLEVSKKSEVLRKKVGQAIRISQSAKREIDVLRRKLDHARKDRDRFKKEVDTISAFEQEEKRKKKRQA